MNRTIGKTILREIRGSLGRYLAILAIIALGSGFFAGLKACRPAMLEMADGYVREHNMFDYRLLSTLGYESADVELVSAAEQVASAEGLFSADVLCAFQDNADTVLAAHSLPEKVNTVHLEAGRMPERPDECLVDYMLFDESDIGRTIRLSDDNDADTLEKFGYREYTICGVVDSVIYLNFERGNTSLGNGRVSGFLYIPYDGFDVDYYTEIDLTLVSAADAYIYSETYKTAVEDAQPEMEKLAQSCAQRRYDAIQDEASAQLDEAQAEYENGRAEFEEKSAEVEKELSAAASELEQNEQKLSAAQQSYAENVQKLQKSRQEVQDGLKQVQSGQETLDAQRTEYEKNRAEFETQRDAALPQLEAQLSQLDAQAASLNTALSQIQEEISRLEGQTGAQAEAQRQALEARQQETQAALTQVENGRAQAQAAKAQFSETQAQLDDAEARLEAGQKELGETRTQLQAALAEIERGQTQLNAAQAQLTSGRQQLESGRTQLQEARTRADAELQDGRAQLDSAAQELQNARESLDGMETPESYALGRNTNIGYACFESDSDIVDSIAAVFPVFFFLVAALICMTTMTRMVDEQRTQIGVLKALGYGKSAIMTKYMAYAGSAGLIGSVSGFFLGSLVFPKVVWIGYQIMYNFAEVQFYFSPLLFAGTVLTCLLCAMGSTWLACNQELSEAPAELIRPKAPKNGKRIFLERISFIWKRLKFLQKVSIRNVVRYKKRMLMMILGIGGCTALVLTGFGLRDSVSSVVDYQYDEITVYDCSVTLTESAEAAQVREMLSGVPGVSDWLLLHQSSMDVQVGDTVKSVNLLIPESGSLEGFFDLHDGAAEVPFPGTGEAVMNRNLAGIFGLSVGDSFTLLDADRKPMTLRLSGVFDNYVYNYVVVSRESCESQWGYVPEMKTVYLNLEDGADPASVSAKLLGLEQCAAVTASADFRDRIATMMKSLDYIVGLVILCAGGLAFIVLYNLTNINITERIREIATLKVLGFYGKETASYVFRENMLLTLFGALSGLLLGRALHAFVISEIKIDLMSFDVRVAGLSYVWAVALTFVFACVVNFVMYFKLQKINMAESLKTIE